MRYVLAVALVAGLGAAGSPCARELTLHGLERSVRKVEGATPAMAAARADLRWRIDEASSGGIVATGPVPERIAGQCGASGGAGAIPYDTSGPMRDMQVCDLGQGRLVMGSSGRFEAEGTAWRLTGRITAEMPDARPGTSETMDYFERIEVLVADGRCTVVRADVTQVSDVTSPDPRMAGQGTTITRLASNPDTTCTVE